MSKYTNEKYIATPEELQKAINKILVKFFGKGANVDFEHCKRLIKEQYDKHMGVSVVKDYHTEVVDCTDGIKRLKVYIDTFYLTENDYDLVPQDMPYTCIYFKLKGTKNEEQEVK